VGIPEEEEALLARVQRSLAGQAPPAEPSLSAAGGGSPGADALSQRARAAADRHVAEMVALRDEIGEARLEDVPQLVAQMERLQNVALTRAEMQRVLIDGGTPYFGHLRLREQVEGRGTVERDVLVGRATFVDPKARINIVDWRNAPVSQLFYRYSEGSDYDERFGDRDVEGEILVRRTVTIEDRVLERVACPQGVWVRVPPPSGTGTGEPTAWERTDLPIHELAGGEATATRPGRVFRPGVLGAGALVHQPARPATGECAKIVIFVLCCILPSLLTRESKAHAARRNLETSSADLEYNSLPPSRRTHTSTRPTCGPPANRWTLRSTMAKSSISNQNAPFAVTTKRSSVRPSTLPSQAGGT